MRDPLAVLIRLAEWRIDARQRALAEARRALDGLRHQREGLIAEMASEAAMAAADGETLAAWGAYAARAKHRLAELAARIAAAEARVGDEQEALREEFAAGKRLEILSERRTRERRAEAEHREQSTLDDLAQRRPAPLPL